MLPGLFSGISSLDMFALSAENETLNKKVKQQECIIHKLEAEAAKKDAKIKEMEIQINKHSGFCVQAILNRTTIKDLFKFYTGITYVRFLALLVFLIPNGFSLTFEKGRRDIKTLPVEDCFFLTLCRLRHNFALKYLSMRFGISLQSCGVVFNTCINHMYHKLGQLCIWPHRDVIIGNMPENFKRDFPSTLIIIDGTEIRTQKPSALALQSQLYSDYKSSNTLKCLIGCDPNGSIIFVSELFTGSISDY